MAAQRGEVQPQLLSTRTTIQRHSAIRRGSAPPGNFMASETKVTPQKEQVPQGEDPASPPDHPLLDLSDAAIKKLIRTAKKRGYVTHDQINSVLPSEEVNSEQIEDVLAMFSEMGVNVVETEEASEDDEQREEPEEEAEPESSELVEVRARGPSQIRGQGAHRAHR